MIKNVLLIVMILFVSISILGQDSPKKSWVDGFFLNDLRQEPLWFNNVRAYTGYGFNLIDKAHSPAVDFKGISKGGFGYFTFSEVDYHPFSFSFEFKLFTGKAKQNKGWGDPLQSSWKKESPSKPCFVSYGIHLGQESSFGETKDVYRWETHAFEIGASLVFQEPNWYFQSFVRVSYRFLRQSGKSLSSTYRNDGQTNHQLEFQVILEKYFDSYWCSLVQTIITVQQDFSRFKKSSFNGITIDSKNDPAGNQSVYGVDLAIHVWNDYKTDFVPIVGAGYYYNQWDEFHSVKFLLGVRAYDFIYINVGRQWSFTGKTQDHPHVWFVSFGIDPIAGLKRIW